MKCDLCGNKAIYLNPHKAEALCTACYTLLRVRYIEEAMEMMFPDQEYPPWADCGPEPWSD